MTFRLALAQVKDPGDGDVIALVGRFAAQAKERGAELVAFPESLMTRYGLDRDAFIAKAQPLDGPFATAVEEIAAEQGIWMLYTANEFNPYGNPFNTAVLVDDEGTRRGVYRKVHLFDTDFTRESEKMAPGSELFEPVETPFARIGLGICYDLRFPELSRTAARADADLLLFPAAWVDGPDKLDHWLTLLRARAIENEVFVAGICRADEGRVGHSCIIDPLGHILAEAGGDEEELVVGDIDLDAMVRARKAMPILDHVRDDLY
ncbi:MAG: carbon-nitrogen hydrolase family protein [Coriobacteriales bacterium]|jgi:predicted amidohydrolase